MFSKLWAKLSGNPHNETHQHPDLTGPHDTPQGQLEQLNSKVAALYQIGRYYEAIEYATQSVDLTGDTFGDQHPDLATSLNNLARLYRETGQLRGC
jgi:hypothetical protein